MFGAKSLLAVAFGMSLAVALAIVSEALFARGQHEGQVELYVASAIVSAMELFGWSVAFSLLTRQPLWAAVLGVIVPSALLGLVYPALLESDRVYELFGTHLSYLAPRTVVAMLVLAVDVVLARYWFHDRPLLPSLSRRRKERGEAVADAPIPSVGAAGRGSPNRFVSYLWLTFRQARPLYAAVVGSVGAIVLAKFLLGRNIDPGFIMVAMSLCAIACGFASFGFDQFGGNYRFLSEQGTNVRTLWCVRQAVWGGTFLAALMTLFVCNPVPGDIFATTAGLFAPMCLFVVAQIAGLFQRRFVIAIMLPFLAAPLVLAWSIIMWRFMLPGVCLWLPLAFFFYATFRRIQAWYDDRYTRRDSYWLAALLGLPPVVILASLSVYRAYEIPRTDPGFSIVEFQRDTPSADIFSSPLDDFSNRVSREIDDPQSRKKFFDELDQFLAGDSVQLWSASHRFMQVENQVPPAYSHLTVMLYRDLATQAAANSASENWHDLQRMLRLLHLADRRCGMSTFRHSEAQEAQTLWLVSAWSRRPDVTVEQLQAACRELGRLELDQAAFVDVIKNAHLQYVSDLEGYAHSTPPSTGYLMGGGLMSGGTYVPPEFLRWFPTERARTSRLLDHVTAMELVRMDVYLKKLRSGVRIDSTELLSRRFSQQTAWSMNSIEPQLDTDGYFLRHAHVLRISRLRAVQLQLAIAAYARREGKLPASLADVIDDNLQAVPIDPLTGRPIQYVPKGFDAEVVSSHTRTPIPRKTPLIWCASVYHFNLPQWLLDSEMNSLFGKPDVTQPETRFISSGEVYVVGADVGRNEP